MSVAGEVTWETCDLRSWMNDDFYNAAFDDEMKACINTVTIVTEDNQSWETSSGNDTSDKIFVLSESEIKKYYSFNLWDSVMECGYSEALIIPPTKYAEDNGVYTRTLTNSDFQYILSDENYSEDCIGKIGSYWWLRSPGRYDNTPCIVDAIGRTGTGGQQVLPGYWTNDVGVRPALYINK